jgi:hypothetical protein
MICFHNDLLEGWRTFKFHFYLKPLNLLYIVYLFSVYYNELQSIQTVVQMSDLEIKLIESELSWILIHKSKIDEIFG